METVAKRLYEAMFLVDSAQAAADWDGTLAVVNNILQRADAEVVAMRKWQERKLAYDIDRTTRGTYILCYFKVDGRRISGIEKDVQLSEKVMRVLVLTTEGRPADMLERDISGEPEKPAEEAAPAEASAKPAEETPAAEQETPKKPEEAPAEQPAEAAVVEAEPAAEAASSESEGSAEEKKDESAE